MELSLADAARRLKPQRAIQRHLPRLPRLPRLPQLPWLPRLILMTDAARMPDPYAMAARLPRGALVILRDYDHAERAALAALWCRAARRYGLMLVIGADRVLARQVRADGVHWPEALIPLRPQRGFRLQTCAAHNRSAIRLAKRAGIDLALVSPIFATNSHPGARCLGVSGYRAMVRNSGVAIAALGGITAKTARALVDPKPAALAAISGFVTQALEHNPTGAETRIRERAR